MAGPFLDLPSGRLAFADPTDLAGAPPATLQLSPGLHPTALGVFNYRDSAAATHADA